MDGPEEDLSFAPLDPNELASLSDDSQADTTNPNGSTTTNNRPKFFDNETLDVNFAFHGGKAQSSQANVQAFYLVKAPKTVVDRWKWEVGREVERDEEGRVLKPRVLGTLRVHQPMSSNGEKAGPARFEIVLPPSFLDPEQDSATLSQTLAESSTVPSASDPNINPSSSPSSPALDNPPPSSPSPSSPITNNLPTSLDPFTYPLPHPYKAPTDHIPHSLIDFPGSEMTESNFMVDESTGRMRDRGTGLAARRCVWLEDKRKFLRNGRGVGKANPRFLGAASKISNLVATIDADRRKAEIRSRYEVEDKNKTKMRRLDKEGYSQRQINTLLSGGSIDPRPKIVKGEKPINTFVATKKSTSTNASSSSSNPPVLPRMERGDLVDLLFECFNEYEYWSLRNLKMRLSQPESWIKDVMTGIAVQEKSGPYTNLWRLNDKYHKIQDTVHAGKAAPDDLEISQSVMEKQAFAAKEAAQVELNQRVDASSAALRGNETDPEGGSHWGEDDDDDEDEDDEDEDMEEVGA